MVEPFVIPIVAMIIAILMLIFKDNINDIFYQIHPELSNGEPIVLNTVEKVILVIYALFFVYWIIYNIQAYIESKKYDKFLNKESEEFEERKKLFLNKIHIPQALEYIEDVIVLEFPVQENYYDHRKTVDSFANWGVYVDKFFLKCENSYALCRCVNTLRDHGIEIKYDSSFEFAKGTEAFDRVYTQYLQNKEEIDK